MSVDSKIELVPNAANLISSLRAVGYSIETSIADLIDNSITAEATLIKLEFGWRDGRASFFLYDNGYGMSEDELLKAMTFASSHVLEERGHKDLGRFGLGLKVASFSHCRILEVASKKVNSAIASYFWDLNKLEEQKDNRWTVLKTDENELKGLSFPDGHGSYVFWKDIDSIATKMISEEGYLEAINVVESHISKTFHRFIEDGVTILINGKVILPKDPVYELRPIYTSPTEYLGNYLALKAYVYDWSVSEAKKYVGKYFIYRANRLICSGTIKQLTKSDFKSLNLEIFIENNVDALWSIDIAKSKAIPPSNVQKRIAEFLSLVKDKTPKRKSGLEKTVDSNVWFKNTLSGSFQINHEHPFIQKLNNSLEKGNKEILSKLLTEIESSIPHYVKKIYIDKSNQEKQEISLSEDISQEIRIQLLRLIKVKKMSKEAAIKKLQRNELFQSFGDEIESIAQQMENSVG